MKEAYSKILLSFLLLCCPLILAAQKQHYSLQGTIKDEKGQVIELATISLNNSISALSDKDGHYSFPKLSPGTYNYVVRFVGYDTQSGTVTISNGNVELNIKMPELTLKLDNVVVTARQQQMGSKSLIDQEAIRHIQPKSLSDILQLVPGNLTENPNLNQLAQAHIREIGDDDNNALGTAVVVDGSPLANDANLQHISTSRYGSASSATADGMSDQTTAGRGTDLRTVSAGNIESVEVVRGIPSVEYGNLTSGLIVVKTKSGYTPWEIKAQADPYSKLVYAGKGFSLKQGGAVNFSVDWSQSWGDVRRHADGYDRITASAGYSNTFGPLSFNVKGAFYSNVNNNKEDAQYQELGIHYKNKNIGGRLSINGKYNNRNGFITGLSYDLSAQYSRTLDEHYDLVTNTDGIIINSREPGIYEGVYKNKAYNSTYQIEGRPLNLYGQLVANKYIQLGGDNFTDVKLGVEYTHDSNHGDGLTYDVNNPPQASSAQTLRPRSYKDIPALNTLSAFLSDRLNANFGTHRLQVEAGVRLSNLFLNKDKSGGKGNFFVAEPRVNASLSLWNNKNSRIFDDFSLTGGFGLSNKMPTLLYLYPDAVYYDNVSLNHYSDTPANSLALVTTDVVKDTQNPDLKPTRSRKWEIGLSFRKGKFNGFVTYYNEHHDHEFGFDSQLYYAHYNRYDVPADATNLQFNAADASVRYSLNGQTLTAATSPVTRMYTWGRPANNTRSHKYGIEYGFNFGEWRAIRTSLSVNGAWFHTKRISETPGLNYIDLFYDYVGVMPAGSGTVRDRVNSTFRFVTHIPAVRMIFTTSVQVVWYESARAVYETNGTKAYHTMTYQGRQYLAVDPIGFYTRDGQYSEWTPEMENDATLQRMVDRAQTYGYEKDVIHPWAMLNFRFTKEIGRIAEISFIANNFSNSSRYHTNKWSRGRTQIFPDAYFGAEVKIKL